MKGPDWERGYRDGWFGTKPEVAPFQAYLKGFAAGDRDRRYGRASHADLVQPPRNSPPR